MEPVRIRLKLASHIKNDLKIPALAHLTCVSSTKEEVHKVIRQLQKEGIENILALRGDIPQDGQFPLPGQYSHACELIEDIKKMETSASELHAIRKDM